VRRRASPWCNSSVSSALESPEIGGARAEEDDDPTDQVPEEGAHGPRILPLSLKWKTWKSFVSRLLEVLRRQSNYISEERHFDSDYVLIVFYDRRNKTNPDYASPMNRKPALRSLRTSQRL